MARPRRENEAELRTEHVGFYVTPAERAELDRRATVTGRPRSDYCRIVLLSDLKAPAPSVVDYTAVHELVTQISRVGNNVNQVAHIANERRDLPSLKVLDEVKALIKACLEKVMAL
jgi:hypothetical protein